MFFVSLTALLCGIFIRNSIFMGSWMVFWFACLPVLAWYAYWNYYEAIRISGSTKFTLREELITTLNAAKAPEDVIGALRNIKGEPKARVIEGEHRLYSELKKNLGSERTREIMHVVFKYAKE
jgi:hypothetical protein